MDTTPNLPAHDTAGLRDLAASIRAGHADIANTLYHDAKGNPLIERINASELHVASMLAAAGVVAERPRTPQEQAQRHFDASWPSVGNDPHVETLLQDLLAKEELKGVEGMQRAFQVLRSELGPVEHDKLIEKAGAALPLGKTLSPGHKSNIHALKLLAARADYLAARLRATPRT
jgi:hypothetical protein